MLDHTKPYVEKMHWYIDAELAGHIHKLGVKLQSVGVAFLCLLCAFLPKPCHFGVNWPTTLCENEDGIHFFTLKFECHNRYNKLLLCNSENGDIASCNKNNSKWGFCVFCTKRTKNCFYSKNKNNRIKKQVGCFFDKSRLFSTLIVFQSFLWYSLDRTIWNKSRRYQFEWVCAAHWKYGSLVMTKLRITGIWIWKN